MGRFDDMIGKTFGQLTVLSIMPPDPSVGQKDTMIICRCSCGEIKGLRAVVVKSGNTRSCGCRLKTIRESRRKAVEGAPVKHGQSYTPSYHLWCRIKRDSAHNDVPMDPAWMEFAVFYDWLASQGGYSKDRRISMVDPSLGYTPDNCSLVIHVSKEMERKARADARKARAKSKLRRQIRKRVAVARKQRSQLPEYITKEQVSNLIAGLPSFIAAVRPNRKRGAGGRPKAEPVPAHAGTVDDVHSEER